MITALQATIAAGIALGSSLAGWSGYQGYLDLAASTAVQSELAQAGSAALGRYAQTQDLQGSLAWALDALVWAEPSQGTPVLEPGVIRYRYDQGSWCLVGSEHPEFGAKFIVSECPTTTVEE